MVTMVVAMDLYVAIHPKHDDGLIKDKIKEILAEIIFYRNLWFW